MRIEAYLFFGGQAEEAMKFYQSVLGGELEVTHRGDVDPEAPDDMKDMAINASLTGDGFIFRAADNTDLAGAGSQGRIALTLIGSDEPKLRKVYDGLAVGGSADQPLEKQFWGDIFGALTDKYGISWQINIGDAKPLPN
jgi:PhnB protein